jgi:hypothetical protein
MVELIIQEKKRNTIKNSQVWETKKVQFFDKISRFIPQVSNPGIYIQVEALMWSHQVTGL